MMTAAVVRIEVGFDLVCPWCLIGLRNLQQALQQLRAEQPQAEIALRWCGVQLLPEVPAGGWPFLEFYRQRLGSDAAVRQRQAVVQQAAQAAGVRIHYSAIRLMPNTAAAHQMLEWAASQQGSVDVLLERLLCAYFEQGADLGDRALLLEYGVAAGYARAALQSVLQGASLRYRPAYAAPASSGVPSYAINGKLALSGAQPVAVLLAALRAAIAAADSASAPAGTAELGSASVASPAGVATP